VREQVEEEEVAQATISELRSISLSRKLLLALKRSLLYQKVFGAKPVQEAVQNQELNLKLALGAVVVVK
jgi:hypothetical protein